MSIFEIVIIGLIIFAVVYAHLCGWYYIISSTINHMKAEWRAIKETVRKEREKIKKLQDKQGDKFR